MAFAVVLKLDAAQSGVGMDRNKRKNALEEIKSELHGAIPGLDLSKFGPPRVPSLTIALQRLTETELMEIMAYCETTNGRLASLMDGKQMKAVQHPEAQNLDLP